MVKMYQNMLLRGSHAIFDKMGWWGKNGIPIERSHVMQSYEQNMILVYICYFYLGGGAH